jgi:NTP pyrophosphatase (non-canonical NTP hydrolase)
MNSLSDLTFDVLREANTRRLPLFKNRKGEPAHSEPDGSDWLFSAWANAAAGEFGEVAEALLDFMIFTKVAHHLGKGSDLIKKIERGDVTVEEKRDALADELADVVTYLDILAMRAGINLGEATIRKWNVVSERVDCPLRIDSGLKRGWINLKNVAYVTDLDDSAKDRV